MLDDTLAQILNEIFRLTLEVQKGAMAIQEKDLEIQELKKKLDDQDQNQE